MLTPTQSEIEAQARKAFVPANLTEQCALVNMLGGDLAKAAELAARYGGQLGTLKTKNVPPDETGANNPWHDDYKGKDRETHKVQILKLGTRAAASMAKSAGYTILGAKLK